MNCDTAFELMTDVSGSRSSALTRHLESCTRCRQMQETLAPALEFLSHAPPHELIASLAEDPEFSETAGHQPFVTVEALTIANQAAYDLEEATALPRARIRRLGSRFVRYAAVFAAGLLLAIVATPQHESGIIRKRECTRREAADTTHRSTEQIQILIRSCAVCHGTAPANADDQASSMKIDWFVPIDRLLPAADELARVALSGAPAEPETLVADAACRVEFSHNLG
jgi:hypothetical protein